MNPSRRPSVVWSFRKNLRDFVCTEADDQIGIRVDGQTLVCDRPTARLLAKRLNQRLDATTSRGMRERAKPAPDDNDTERTAS